MSLSGRLMRSESVNLPCNFLVPRKDFSLGVSFPRKDFFKQSKSSSQKPHLKTEGFPPAILTPGKEKKLKRQTKESSVNREGNT